MTHTPACENARSHVCKCGGCGGALHGWPDGLRLAQPSRAAQRASFRADADSKWSAATKRRARRLSIRRKAAATDQVKADIIDWIAVVIEADSPDALTESIAETLGNHLANHVMPQMDAEADDRRKLRKTAADHFCCELLAQLACAMDRTGDAFDSMPEQIAKAICAARASDGRARMEEAITEIAVKAMLDGIKKLPPVRHLQDLSRATKILAVLTCPAPEKHRSVVACCVVPMERDIISAEAKEKLVKLLPADWRGGT